LAADVDPAVCGVAYWNEGNGKDFGDSAFSAIMKGCWDGLTTAHEVRFTPAIRQQMEVRPLEQLCTVLQT
jgi:hypothetical protein